MGGDDYDDLVDDPEQIDDMNEDQVGVKIVNKIFLNFECILRFNFCVDLRIDLCILV